MTLARLESYCQRQVESYEDMKAGFLVKLDKAPVHALSWGDSFIQSAANYEMAKELLDEITYHREMERAVSAGATDRQPLTDDELFAALMEKAQRKVLSEASSAGLSSSAMTNLTKRAELAGWAKLLEHMKRGF